MPLTVYLADSPGDRILNQPMMFNILDELKVPFLHFIPGNQYQTVINWFTEQSGMTFDELLEPYCRQVYAGYWEVKWEEVGPGTIVYIDSFQHGKMPFARPRICGPYQVLDPKDKLLLTTWKVGLPSEMRRGEGTFKTLHPRPDEPILIKTPAVDAFSRSTGSGLPSRRSGAVTSSARLTFLG